MDIFQPKQISGECHVKNYVGNVFDYLDGKRKKTDSVTVQNYIDTVELAGLSVLTGNRGVGAVLLRGKELVGTGQNNVSEPDNHLKHVGHAEVNAITDYNTPDGDELPPEEKADLELVSSIGPCCMCLIAAINQKVRTITTLSPDWTGGVSPEMLGALYPGWAVRIEQIKMQYRTINGEGKGIEPELHLLGWALSRFRQFKFEQKEFEEGISRDPLQMFRNFLKRLERVTIAMAKEHGISLSPQRVALAAAEFSRALSVTEPETTPAR